MIKLIKWTLSKVGEAIIQHMVAAALISLGGIAALLAYFWETTKGVLSAISFFFLSPVTFPTWLILLIILIALACMTKLFIIIRAAKNDEQTGVTQVNNYTRDNFEGLVWSWRWYGNTPSDFIPYCPSCDCTLTKTYSGMKHFGQTLHFNCPNCGFRKEIQMDKELLETKITQLIEFRTRKKLDARGS